jgi:hypothetical protein
MEDGERDPAADSVSRRSAVRTTDRRRWATLTGLTLVTFLLLLDDTAVAVALPTIQQQLGLGLDGLEWVVNSYTLTLAVFTTASDARWGAGRAGYRRRFRQRVSSSTRMQPGTDDSLLRPLPASLDVDRLVIQPARDRGRSVTPGRVTLEDIFGDDGLFGDSNY